MSQAQANPQAVICIPGEWKDLGQLMERMTEARDDYLFTGRMLHALQTQDIFELRLENADPYMLPAFRIAGRHWANTKDMGRIARHGSIAYLIGEGGSRKNAEALMAATAAVVKAGGLGVKIESSGVAHSPSVWLDLTANCHLFSAYRAFVVSVGGDDVYSCGMHNLGLRDAIVDASLDDNAPELIRAFTWYLFTESPIIEGGQTFCVEPDAPVYRIHEDEGVSYENGSLFANPYGTWRLIRDR